MDSKIKCVKSAALKHPIDAWLAQVGAVKKILLIGEDDYSYEYIVKTTSDDNDPQFIPECLASVAKQCRYLFFSEAEAIEQAIQQKQAQIDRYDVSIADCERQVMGYLGSKARAISELRDLKERLKK